MKFRVSHIKRNSLIGLGSADSHRTEVVLVDDNTGITMVLEMPSIAEVHFPISSYHDLIPHA